MNFDFDHPDPRHPGFFRQKERPEDKIHLMNGPMPYRTGWIKLLQNRVNLNSTGNIYKSKKVWFDVRTKTVSDEMRGERTVPFRLARLKDGQRPAGWIEC